MVVLYSVLDSIFSIFILQHKAFSTDKLFYST